MPEEITLEFSLVTGEVSIEAHGFKGKSCADATKFLTDTLGKCTDFQKKAEWYESSLKTIGYVNSNLCG